MPGVKGRKKTGGRQPGTPNKRTRELIDLLDERDFCPAIALIKIHRLAMKEFGRSRGIAAKIDRYLDDENFELALRAYGDGKDLLERAPGYLSIAEHAAKEIMNYAFPKRKAIEHTGKGGKPLGGGVVVMLPSNGREAKRKSD